MHVCIRAIGVPAWVEVAFSEIRSAGGERRFAAANSRPAVRVG
jgi:hypothetical protein